MTNKINERKGAVEQLIGQVRELVNTLLKEDVKPSDITFGLAFVAADLGLRITDNQASSISVVNSGVNKAIKAAIDRQKEESQANDEEEYASPSSTLFSSQIH